MSVHGLRSAVGATMIAALGAVSLANSLPALRVDASMCVAQTPSVAWFGIHLSLLTQSVNCPEGSYAAGAGFSPFAQFSVMLSVSALVAGLFALACALGAGQSLLHLVRAARGWLRRRLVLSRPIVLVPARMPAMVPVPVRAPVAHHRPAPRRGPPTSFC